MHVIDFFHGKSTWKAPGVLPNHDLALAELFSAVRKVQ